MFCSLKETSQEDVSFTNPKHMFYRKLLRKSPYSLNPLRPKSFKIQRVFDGIIGVRTLEVLLLQERKNTNLVEYRTEPIGDRQKVANESKIIVQH